MLDTALGVARNLGVQILRVSMNPTFFCIAALVFVFGYAVPELQYTQRPNSTVGQVEEAIGTLALAVFVGGPIFLMGAIYAGSVVTRLTSDFLLGLPVNVPAAEAIVRKRLGSLLLYGFRELFICFGGLLASGALLLASGLLTTVTSPDNPLPGILAVLGAFSCAVGVGLVLILFARRAIVFPVVVIEDVGIRAASARTKTLMKPINNQPNGTGVIGAMYAISLLVYVVISVGLGSVLMFFNVEGLVRTWANHSMGEPLLTTAVDLIPDFCALWALLPFWAIVMTVLYYERRIRVEGFDIEQLAEEIGRDGRTNRFNV